MAEPELETSMIEPTPTDRPVAATAGATTAWTWEPREDAPFPGILTWE